MATTNNLTTNITPTIQTAITAQLNAKLRDGYKIIKEINYDLRVATSNVRQLHRLKAESQGKKAAYIDEEDLTKIIAEFLKSRSNVTAAFKQYALNEGLGEDWAINTKDYFLDAEKLSSALFNLTNNTSLILMNNYKVLDVKDIKRSATYSSALTKLKKQQGIAHALQDKDNQLTNKNSVIAAKDAEIEKLNTELQRNKSEDWKSQAIALKQADISVTKIAKRLGKSRTTISTYLNSPGVKSQIP
jgi:hypothetical protein